MAAACRLVHSLHHPIRGYRVFRDWTNPLDVYDDIKLFLRFRFPRRELLEVIDDFEGDFYFKLKLLSLSLSLSPRWRRGTRRVSHHCVLPCTQDVFQFIIARLFDTENFVWF